ncbi:hypothetical protein M3Y98_00854800 [Aphelenchoides besseyi]|nr:hypothetical protein M3Y98_00854800 [Aphelenchoides besseyi]KAI6211118.1 hypothetical protein M3Y96_00399600 [Aphelenchoides besseyi]
MAKNVGENWKMSEIKRLCTFTILACTIGVVSSAAINPTTNYKYQIATPQTEQHTETLIDTPTVVDADSGEANCRLECEMGSAGECLGCLRVIDHTLLQNNPSVQASDETIDDSARSIAISMEEMDKIISPLLWSPALRNYPGRWPRAERLLKRLRESSAFGNRPHKKDLRVALQRSLNAQDINSLLRNAWVGR